MEAYRDTLLQQMEERKQERAQCIKALRRKEPPPGAAQRRSQLTRELKCLREEDKTAQRAIQRLQTTLECRRQLQQQMERRRKYLAGYYTAEELEQLFEAARGNKLELIIQFAAFYGLRRSEVLGLRWDAVDFEAGTLTIRHIVTSTNIEGKHILVEADRAKTKFSLRTLPLVDAFTQKLRELKQRQEYNREICGNCYNPRYWGYLFVDEVGNLILPNVVTTGFASLLLKQGIPMKQIQQWLGHNDISTTANIYAHLDTESKHLSAQAMAQSLVLPESKSAQQMW